MAELSLADDVKQALIERSGRLGLMLKLIEVLEAGDFDATAQLLQQLPELTPAMLNEAQMAAIRWVSSLSETK